MTRLGKTVAALAVTATLGLLSAIVILLVCLLNQQSSRVTYREIAGYVVSYTDNHAYIEDLDGNLWGVYGTGFTPREYVKMTISDCGTPSNQLDDIVYDIR